MTVFRPDEFDVLADQQNRIRNIEQGCGPFVIPPSADFQNGYDHVGSPYELWGYRLCDDGLEIKGHLLAGTTSTVAYTFPLEYLAFANGDLTDHREIINGITVTLALIEISISSGDMTITF